MVAFGPAHAVDAEGAVHRAGFLQRACHTVPLCAPGRLLREPVKWVPRRACSRRLPSPAPGQLRLREREIHAPLLCTLSPRAVCLCGPRFCRAGRCNHCHVEPSGGLFDSVGLPVCFSLQPDAAACNGQGLGTCANALCTEVRAGQATATLQKSIVDDTDEDCEAQGK